MITLSPFSWPVHPQNRSLYHVARLKLLCCFGFQVISNNSKNPLEALSAINWFSSLCRWVSTQIHRNTQERFAKAIRRSIRARSSSPKISVDVLLSKVLLIFWLSPESFYQLSNRCISVQVYDQHTFDSLHQLLVFLHSIENFGVSYFLAPGSWYSHIKFILKVRKRFSSQGSVFAAVLENGVSEKWNGEKTKTTKFAVNISVSSSRRLKFLKMLNFDFQWTSRAICNFIKSQHCK